MAQFKITSNAAVLSVTPAANDTYSGAFRRNDDGSTVATTTNSAGTWQSGFKFDSTGALIVYDATSGLPATKTALNGFLYDQNGALCVSTNAVSVYLNGLPFDANGALVCSGLAVPVTRLLLVGGAACGTSRGAAGGGGGGGGRVLERTAFTLPPIGTYPVVIGAKTTVSLTYPQPASQGGTTSFNGLSAAGGTSVYGANGPSNGGDSGSDIDGVVTNTTGGTSTGSPNGTNGRMGGGGASPAGNGANATASVAGNGANGYVSDITGANVSYGAGGGGGSEGSATTRGVGGTGGGGNGQEDINVLRLATAGAGNGAGGGGAGGRTAVVGGTPADGSDGIAIISYPTGSATATGGTITTVGGQTIHTFTTTANWIRTS